MTKISVVTATFNAQNFLPQLISSLKAQTDKDFEWVIADGGSTDSTIKLLENTTDLNIKITSQPDFGIYDALNRGIRQSSGEYYIVIGADDVFFPNAIKDFRAAIEKSSADIVTATIAFNGGTRKPTEKKSWYYGMGAFISCHSVGTAFKKDLHNRFGYYSRKFPITADQFFVKKACQGGASRYVSDAVVGEFTYAGVSSTDAIGTLTETFRVQLATEKKFPQFMIFILRIIRHYGHI